MNILIVSPYAINTPHFETELEIAQNHINDGDFVKILYCNADLLACDVNPDHNIPKCLICMNRRKRGVKLLSKKVETMPLINLTKADRKKLAIMNNTFSSIEDLKSLTIDNFDIGYATLSSLVSFTRDPYPDLNKYNDLVQRFISSAFIVYSSINNYLSITDFDKVYIFNGRYAPLRAIYRACQKNKVECLIIERGCSLNHYSIFVNTLPHDINNITELINATWAKEQDHGRGAALAETFFMNPINKVSPTWFAFTEGQKDGLLPADWNAEKENIVIYITSDDEFIAIGDMWKNKIYIDQMDGIKKILASLKDDQNIHVYLRIHPNLKNVKSKQTDEINALKTPQLTLVPANSQISTYALMQNASKVITFGSTVGIEATYWGIPSILVGPALYQHLGSTYNPQSHEEVIEMINSKLPPKDKKGAIKYGFYYLTFGIPFKYYEAIKIKKGKFKNIELTKSRFFLGMYVFLKILLPLDRFISFLDIKRLKKKMNYQYHMRH